jgi:hypothetical protein
MAGIFGSSTATPPSITPRVQTSVQGRPRNIGAGLNRFAGNVIWYGDFKSTPASSGGKGAGGSGKGSTGSYTYSVSFMVSFGEPLAAFNTVFNGNQIDFLVPPSAQVLADLQTLGITPSYGNSYGATFLLGDYAQNPWSYLVSAHPSQALAYRGEALMALANLGLGNSPSLPNFTIEGLWPINSDIPALGPDANPADWVTAFLTNPDWGAGFPQALLGSMAAYQSWARATGMLISPVLTDQTSGNSHLGDIMKGTVADFRWSSGLLTVVPYGDTPVTGNGYTFTPATTPIYDIMPTDYLENQGNLGSASGKSKIAISRKDPAQVTSRVQVEYLDRSNLYNPVTIYDSDDASIIATNRLRLSDLRAHHFFCLGSAASMSAALQMHREKVVTTYQFTLSADFILPDVLDILTLTEPRLVLVKQPVRILEIVENSDHTLTFTCEEFLGSVAAPLYARQMSLGAARNNNVDPGQINPPIIFEPTDELGNGLEVWAAVSGQNTALWGGCNVWASYDPNGSFAQIGTINGPARMGLATSTLPTVAANVAGQTIDNTNTLAVSLVESAGALASGSNVDMTGLNTACYVDGEIIAYQNATLTGAYAYSLAPLVRGAFGSPISAHAVGAAFARLDNTIFKFSYPQARIGQTIYLKFQSFNIYGGGLQDLSTLGQVPYIITGAALASPLPNISNLRAYFEAGVMKVFWDEIEDFRPAQYEIRKGSTWASALKVVTQAHPPFIAFGDDNFWVSAVSQPVSGLTVYSETPQSITIAGALLSQNIVQSYDEQALGWGGVMSNGVATQGVNPTAFLRLGGSGNILTDADVLHTPDVLNYGGVIASGTYEISPAHWIDVGYVAECLVGASYVGTGGPVGQDILAVADFLGMPDVLGGMSAALVDVHVEISIAQSNSNDVFALPDAFNTGDPSNDVFAGSQSFSPWQKFVPGVYVGRVFKFRVVLTSIDGQAIAYCLAFSYQVTVPARTDNYMQQAIPNTGLTITFKPDGAAAAGAFNGGPNNHATPAVSVDGQFQTGDTYQITGLSLSQLTIVFYDNTGTAVARTADIHVQGY